MTAMKRICAIALALCLMVACGFFAFAETPNGLTDVAVDALHNTTIGQSATGEGEITLFPLGKLDVYAQTALREAIDAIPEDTHRLVINFRDVQYITSAGLRELLVCRERFPDDRMLIMNVSPDVMEVFRTVGFDEILPIEEMKEDVSSYVDMSFKELLEYKVRTCPDTPVLKDNKETYTWTDIEYAAQIIAYDLAGLGVGRGSHVGICGVNSVNWILTFYATQKLGAIAMLINPTLSPSEIGGICEIGEITCLCYGDITTMTDEEQFLNEVRAVEGSCIDATYSIRNDIQLKARFSEYEALKGKYEGKVEADAPSIIIFTSGSTGRPKGVILSAHNVLNAAVTQVDLQQFTDQDKELLITPLYHILGLGACLFPTAMANTLLVVPDDTHTATLIETMKAEQCTLLHCVPTMMIALLNSKSFDEAAFENLRCTILSGAACTEAQLTMFSERLPKEHFIVVYGLSEMAPVSMTLYGDTMDHLVNTVGQPLKSIDICIRNPDTGRTCDMGESGEILVQGFNLMTGYYKLAIEDQVIDENGWLHTGDKGYLDEDNYLHFVGRYKDLIIRGGENIMPAEIESAISELDIIENVRVIGVPSDFYGEKVAACVVLKPGAVLYEEQVREQLSGKLAKYKMPSYFFAFDEFPMLGSGKIDGVTSSRKSCADYPKNNRKSKSIRTCSILFPHKSGG